MILWAQVNFDERAHARRLDLFCWHKSGSYYFRAQTQIAGTVYFDKRRVCSKVSFISYYVFSQIKVKYRDKYLDKEFVKFNH